MGFYFHWESQWLIQSGWKYLGQGIPAFTRTGSTTTGEWICTPGIAPWPGSIHAVMLAWQPRALRTRLQLCLVMQGTCKFHVNAPPRRAKSWDQIRLRDHSVPACQYMSGWAEEFCLEETKPHSPTATSNYQYLSKQSSSWVFKTTWGPWYPQVR